MKVIQISDLHLVGAGEKVAGSDPLAQLRAAIADINRRFPDADLVAITGDLTDRGEGPAYELLAGELENLIPPFRLTLGNHDSREAFHAVFGTSGFVQACVDLPAARLLLLDTLDAGQVGGRLCSERLAWLDARLDGAGDRSVFLFMHHPPVDVHLPVLDRIRLADADAFHAVLARHGNVRFLFAGHVHRQIAGAWRGIPFHILRSTNHQVALDFSRDAIAQGPEAPHYALILADRWDVVVHSQEFCAPQA